MKLFYSPGACSLAPHIALREAGLGFELDKVAFGTKKTDSGVDFNAINPKGYVPTLQLDDGQILTEVPAIIQYIADQKPELKLAPAAGTFERYRLQEWLNFIATEIHKPFGALFNPKAPDEIKQAIKAELSRRFDFVVKNLETKPFLLGEDFTVADGYLFNILTWTNYVGFDLGPWSVLKDYMARVSARPAVKTALEAEGLIK